jgi:hypothetical protein
MLTDRGIEISSFVNGLRGGVRKLNLTERKLPNELGMPEAGAPLDEKRVQKR